MAKQKLVLIAVPHETVRTGVCVAFAEEPGVVLHEVTTVEALQQELKEQIFDLVVVRQSLVTDITNAGYCCSASDQCYCS
jgi:DNA-binding NarL/FixJ family response regulator